MIEISAIDHINLSVGDVSRSADFYGRVFGLPVREDGRGAERPYVIVGNPAVGFLALHQMAGLGQRDPATTSTRPAKRDRINHWGFVVDEFDALLGRLGELGVEVLYRDNGADGVIRYPRSRSVYVADPDGNEIELTSRFGGGLE